MCGKGVMSYYTIFNAYFHKIAETEFTIVNKLVSESLVLL